MTASKCPGARKSGKGEFYWTEDPTVCIDAEKTGRMIDNHLLHFKLKNYQQCIKNRRGHVFTMPAFSTQ